MARGGHGLSTAQTNHRERIIERIVYVLPENPQVYPVWRRLLVAHGVMGVQVHDARLAAVMRVHGVSRLLTLNPGDFKRYDEITVESPEQVLAAH